MTTNGEANITIDDSGGSSVIVPSSQVQFVMGCCEKGTVGRVFATRSAKTLLDEVGYGPLSEAAGLVLRGKGTVIACLVEQNTPGDFVDVPTLTGSGSSTVTATGTPLDDYLVELEVARGGTLGAAGITARVSLDAGRTQGPPLKLPTTTTVHAGSITSSPDAFPVALEDGDDFQLKTDQDSADTATIQATPAILTGDGATYAAVTGGHFLIFSVAGVSGTQPVYFDGSENDQASFIATINSQLEGAFAQDDGGGELQFVTFRQGLTAAASLVSGSTDVISSLGLAAGAFVNAGPNNVDNVGAVTAAELKALFDAAFTGGTAGSTSTVNENGSLTVASNTTGGTPKGVQFSGGTGVAKIAGFDNSEHNGSDTALYELEIPNTGVTVQFSAGTLVAGDLIRFATTGPRWTESAVEDAIDAFKASSYSQMGEVQMHLVGPCSGSVVSQLQVKLEELTDDGIYARLMVDVRDAGLPEEWGGDGETEGDWMDAVVLDYSGVDARRVMACVGHYNTPSAFENPVAGRPLFRRSLGWAQAARQVGIPPQRHSGRVKKGSDNQGGALQWLIRNPVTDPQDGFIYHDERLNPVFDRQQGGAGAFCSARSRKRPGWFIVNPLLLSPPGSKFLLWPHGVVIDQVASALHQLGEEEINDDIRTNIGDRRGAVGTIVEADAQVLERRWRNVLDANFTAKGVISGVKSLTIDRDNNIITSNEINVACEIVSRGYALQVNISLAYADTEAAAA